MLAECVDLVAVTFLTSYFLGDIDLSELDHGLLIDFVDSDDLPDVVLEEGLSVMQLLELLVTRSNLVRYILAQHAMICLYHTVAVYAFRTTLGKTITGMRVVSNQMALRPNGAVEARGPTLVNAAVRALAKSMTWLCAIVFIAAAIEPSGQCIHDQIAGTLVVRRPTRCVHL
jgi:hypothetical protein